MSTHNICFSRELNKILCGYALLSVAMCRQSDLPFQMFEDYIAPDLFVCLC